MPNQRPTALLDLAYCAVFAALIIVLAFVSIPVGSLGVPIVLQNAAIILTGLVLGARRGFFAIAIVIILGLVLPVLAGGRTVTSAMAGPTAGYIVGYVLSVIVAGLIAYRAPAGKRAAQAVLFAIAGVLALLTQYLFGVLGLMIRSGLDFGAAVIAQGPFIVPDLAKIVVMVLIALGVHAAFPQLLARRRAVD